MKNNTLIKAAVIVTAAIAACTVLAGCSNGTSDPGGSSSQQSESSKTPSERTAELLEAVEHPEMVEVTGDSLSMYYGEMGVSEFSAYLCGSGAMPDEFGVFIAEDEEAAETVRAVIEERVEKQRQTYADYTPDEMYKFDDCFVKQDGTLVYYAVCADNAAAEDILGG